MRDTNTLGREVDPFYARVAGMIRRVAISLTTKALWQLVGHKMPDGPETFNAEVFPGVGFFSRPPASGSPEAIVVNVGDAKTPVIIATRDEKTRQAVVSALKANETAIFNSKSLVIVKDDETIEARAKNGVAVSLATKQDLLRIIDAIDVAVIALGANPAAAALTALKTALQGLIPVWPAGTTKLKGQ